MPVQRGHRRAALGGVLGSMAALTLWGLYFFYFSDNFHVVIPGAVYRSAQLAPDALEGYIRRLGIKSLINLRGAHPKRQWYRDELAVLESTGTRHLDYELQEFILPDRHRLLDLIQRFERLPKPILVHCRRGADRTGLASLLARLSHGGATLEEAWLEASLRRRSFFEDSVGKQFYRQYRDWLITGELPHTPERLRQFLAADYRDGIDNIRFGTGLINRRRVAELEEGRFRLPPNARVDLSGWAFDPQSRSPPRAIEVLAGDEPVAQAILNIPSPELAELFHDAAMGRSRWRAAFPLPDLVGCTQVRLRFTRGDGRQWVSNPQLDICSPSAK